VPFQDSHSHQNLSVLLNLSKSRIPSNFAFSSRDLTVPSPKEPSSERTCLITVDTLNTSSAKPRILDTLWVCCSFPRQVWLAKLRQASSSQL
jgi:hypothetical protein